MQRLDMTFADRGDYRAFWQQHPSFDGIWSAEVEAQIQHDLIGEPPEMRSACLEGGGARSTGASCSTTRPCATRIDGSEAPLTLLWAPRGMMDEPPGLYREERIDGVENELVPDTNHYSILLGEPGRAPGRRGDQRACAPGPGTRT